MTRGGAIALCSAVLLRVRRNPLDVGGTIWLDSATFLVRRIELEFVDGDDQLGSVRLDFSDVAVAGGTLRMPIGGEFDMRPSRKDPARRERRLTWTYTEDLVVPRSGTTILRCCLWP